MMTNISRIVYRKLVKFFCKSEPSQFTEEGMSIARKYHLESEVKQAMKFGFNPDEALQAWDLYPYNETNN